MTVIPYLTFPGTCHDAMTAYADIFGTKIDMMMRAHEMPDFPVTDDTKDMIAHASMTFAGGEIYASDAFSDNPQPMAGSSVMVSLADKDAAKSAFDKLADGGDVTMPFTKMFWAEGFGTVVDRFGIRWMISTET